MLTKQLKFDNDVLSTLRAMAWSPDGTCGVLVGQLERKLYVNTNKALEAMGGTWNKKAKGHLFASDPRSQVAGLLDTGSLTVERDGFFETPEAVVSLMLDLVPLPKLPDFVLEPSAGEGAILRVLLQQPFLYRHVFDFCEKNQERHNGILSLLPQAHSVGLDFMGYNPSLTKYGRIYMNPPFEDGQDMEHVMHAYSMLDEDGILVSVMSEGVFFRTDKKAVAFRAWLDDNNTEVVKLPDGSFKQSGTGVSTRLVVIRN